jgi:hypothetical protein
MLTERGSLMAVTVLLVVFALGAERMLEWRYEQGDVYPPYSSLRADPLGAKAYYEGLDGLQGAQVSRILNSIDKLGPGQGRALFVLGASEYQLREAEPSEADDLQHFLAGGGRVIFTLYPEGRALHWTDTGRSMSKKKGATNDFEAEFRPVSLEDRFGFSFRASAFDG